MKLDKLAQLANLVYLKSSVLASNYYNHRTLIIGHSLQDAQQLSRALDPLLSWNVRCLCIDRKQANGDWLTNNQHTFASSFLVLVIIVDSMFLGTATIKNLESHLRSTCNLCKNYDANFVLKSNDLIVNIEGDVYYPPAPVQKPRLTRRWHP